MDHPKHIQTDQYTYELPEERIAQFPPAERDASKLLVYQNQQIRETTYAQISHSLPVGSLLVFNDTRVIPARVLFQKTSGGVIEVFLLEPAETGGYATLTEQGLGAAVWRCLIGGASKWKHGQVLQKDVVVQGSSMLLRATLADRWPGSFVIRFEWTDPRISFAQVLEQAGSVPIPPYLKRGAAGADSVSYQTIYARQNGSVAAPTAGLHFTEAVFHALREKGIDTATLTLHVGAGTFLPVKTPTLEQHTMHAEWIQVEPALLDTLVNQTGPVFAVGTTSLRTLESLYWMGVKCTLDPGIAPEALAVQQWDPYEALLKVTIEPAVALQALQRWMADQGQKALSVHTSLLIAPPYKPRIARGLITNFHQPGSTLLLLVAAVTGNRWRDLYEYALAHDFRFLSYGDGCLIFFD